MPRSAKALSVQPHLSKLVLPTGDVVREQPISEQAAHATLARSGLKVPGVHGKHALSPKAHPGGQITSASYEKRPIVGAVAAPICSTMPASPTPSGKASKNRTR